MGILASVQREQRNLTAVSGQKQISHHPELEGRVHLLRQTTSGIQNDQMADYADYARVYKVYTWVNKAIRKIADNFAPLPVRVVDADGEAIPNHPISVLFTNGNDQTTPPELWEKYIIHKMLGGESFFEVVEGARGLPLELWVRRPDEVGLKPDVSPERKFFPRVAQYLWPDDKNPIDPMLMWHDKFYNPINQWRGLAPITAVRNGIIIDMFAQAWSKQFLQKGARPDFALIAPQGITSSEREELEFALMDKFAGPDNWHKPIILEEGVTDIKPFSHPPKDIEWLEQRRFSRDEVGAIFGVPDGIMGFGNEAYDNAEKLNAHMLAFWVLTLKPLSDRRDASLTHFFSKVRQDLRPGERIATDLSGVGVLQEDQGPKFEKAKSLFSIGVPFNVIDDRLNLGIGPIPGGEVGYLPVSLLPADQIAMPAPTPEIAPPADVPQLAAGRIITKQSIPYGSDRHKALWQEHKAALTKHERAMQRELKRQFQIQQNDVLRKFRELTAGASADGRTKVQIDLPMVDDLFDRRTQAVLFVSIFRRYLDNAAQDFGQRTASQFAIDFDLRNTLTSEALAAATQKFAVAVTDTTWNQIKAALGTVSEEGQSIPQAQDLINNVFNGRKSDFETERIARTEISGASTTGTLEAGRQAQALGIRLRKAWLAALDTRTRESHVQAHIEYQDNPIGIEENFTVGGCSGPGPSQTGCAAEDINCRCTITYVTV